MLTDTSPLMSARQTCIAAWRAELFSGQLVEQKFRGIPYANNNAVSTNPTKLDYDGFLEDGGTFHDA